MHWPLFFVVALVDIGVDGATGSGLLGLRGRCVSCFASGEGDISGTEATIRSPGLGLLLIKLPEGLGDRMMLATTLVDDVMIESATTGRCKCKGRGNVDLISSILRSSMDGLRSENMPRLL